MIGMICPNCGYKFPGQRTGKCPNCEQSTVMDKNKLYPFSPTDLRRFEHLDQKGGILKFRLKTKRSHTHDRI